MRQPVLKTFWKYLMKLNIHSPYDPATLLLGIRPQTNENSPHKDLCMVVRSSFIHNSSKQETQIFVKLYLIDKLLGYFSAG